MADEVVWILGGIAGYMVVNRLLSRWLTYRAMRAHYHAEINQVLNADEHKVKGRFE